MAKQLKQLLQEKQEPFILELYLVEKGYLRKNFDRRRQKGIPKCSKLLRAFYNQVISLNYRLIKIKSSSPRDVGEDISTVFDSCNGSDSEETSSTSQRKRREHVTVRVTEVVTDTKLQCQCIDERTNSSSIKQNKGTNTTCTVSPKKVTEDSILSASLCEILFHSAREKTTLRRGVPEIQELVHSQQQKSKKVMQQTRQFLFDCVREIVETQEKKQKTTKHLATHEEFGKLIEEKIKCWPTKQYGVESKLECLLESEFRDSAHEWRTSYKPHGRKIGCEIGDVILDELMNEIVMDMASF